MNCVRQSFCLFSTPLLKALRNDFHFMTYFIYHIFMFMNRAAHLVPSGCGVLAFPSWFSTTCHKIVLLVITSGVPQVCILWLGVSRCMLPVKDIGKKILNIMAVNFYGRQLARMLGWAAPAYHKKKGVARIMERASLACSMMGGLMSALGCRLGRGI